MISKNFKDWVAPIHKNYTINNGIVHVKCPSNESTAFKYDLLTKKGDEYILKLKVKIISGSCVVKFTTSSNDGTIYDTHVITTSGVHIIRTTVPHKNNGTLCVHVGSPYGYDGEFEIHDIYGEANNFKHKLECYAKFKVGLEENGKFSKSSSYDSVNLKLDKCKYDSNTKLITLCVAGCDLPLSKRPTILINAINEGYRDTNPDGRPTDGSLSLYTVNTKASFFDNDGDLNIPLYLIDLTNNEVGLPARHVFFNCIVF